MRDQLEALLTDIDGWARERDLQLPCYLLGGAALRLFEGVGTRTKDLDLVSEPLGKFASALAEAFGRDTGRDPYLDLVSAGLPVLPVGWRSRAEPVPGPWSHLVVHRLSAVDHVASKLKSFRPHDRRDIQILCDLYPELAEPLAAFTVEDFWSAPDIWEERIAPNRDRVLRWLSGETHAL